MKWQNYISLLLVFAYLAACKPIRVSKTKVILYDIKSENGIDSSLYKVINSYKVQMDTEMNTIISYLPEDLVKEQPSCNIGNMMADYIYNYFLDQGDTLDFAIMNQGGIRSHFIPKGPLNIGDAFEIMPFENKIVQLDISGEVLHELIEHIINLGGWPISNGEIILNRDGSIKSIIINGEPLNTNKKYRIATNDYIASGGDQCNFLINLPRKETNALLRDVIIETWKKEKEGIRVDNQKRIHYE